MKMVQNARQERFLASPQWKDGRFRNETGWEWLSLGNYSRMLFDYTFSRTERSPKRRLPVAPIDLSHYCDRSSGRLNATWLGHSSVLLNIDGIRIVTDPVFSNGVTLLGPYRYSGPPPLSPAELPETDVVIVSHNHHDHLNPTTVRGIQKKVGVFVTPLGVGRDLQRCGISPDRIVELDWWEAFESPAGVTFTATPAQHFSGRGLRDRDRSLWASFVIRGPSHAVFFSGDSGYFGGFAEIGRRFGPFDLAFIETGAYSKYWHSVHMFPEEAVRAYVDVRGGLLHPIHWGTFNLSLHAWYDPMRRLVAEAKARGVRYSVPVTGQTTIVGARVHTDEWWESVLGGGG